jgi:hypothetical protein
LVLPLPLMGGAMSSESCRLRPGKRLMVRRAHAFIAARYLACALRES